MQTLSQHRKFLVPGAASLLLIVLWSLGAGKELWFDERFVQVISAQSLPRMFELLRLETNPPFFFLLVHFWQQLVGTGEAALRVLSLLPSVAAIFVVQHLVRNVLGATTAMVASFFIAVSGIVVTQSVELRAYPWLMLWIVLAITAAWKLAEQWKIKTLVWFCMFVLLGLFTQYLIVCTAIPLFAWLFFLLRRNRKTIFIAAITVALLFLPWFFLSILPKIHDGTFMVLTQRLPTGHLGAILVLNQLIVPNFFQGPPWLILHVIAFVLLGTGTVFASILSFSAPMKPTGAKKLLRLLVALFCFGLVALIISGLSLLKYSTLIFPPLAVLTAYGLVRIPVQRNVRYAIGCILVVIFFITSLLYVRIPNNTYRAAASVVEEYEQNDDRVLIYPFNDVIALLPYYHGQNRPEGYFPLKDPGLMSLEDVTLYNYRIAQDPANTERLERYVQNVKRVWFFFNVSPFTDKGQPIHQWFLDHGYLAKVHTEVFRNVPPLLVEYTRLKATL